MRYAKGRKGECALANFLFGQAKLAIYKTHKTEMEEGNGKDLVGVFKTMVRTRVAADFAYLKMTDELLFSISGGALVVPYAQWTPLTFSSIVFIFLVFWFDLTERKVEYEEYSL